MKIQNMCHYRATIRSLFTYPFVIGRPSLLKAPINVISSVRAKSNAGPSVRLKRVFKDMPCVCEEYRSLAAVASRIIGGRCGKSFERIGGSTPSCSWRTNGGGSRSSDSGAILGEFE
jgi:hypothetical protein